MQWPITLPSHVEGGEQRGGAVPLVVMGRCAGAAFLHGQPRLRASSTWIWGWMAPPGTAVPIWWLSQITKREPPAMQITTIGLDLAKHIFQIHGVDVFGNIVEKRRLRRAQVLTYFPKLPACL